MRKVAVDYNLIVSSFFSATIPTSCPSCTFFSMWHPTDQGTDRLMPLRIFTYFT